MNPLQLRGWASRVRETVERIVPTEDREAFALHMLNKLESTLTHAYKTWKHNRECEERGA